MNEQTNRAKVLKNKMYAQWQEWATLTSVSLFCRMSKKEKQHFRVLFTFLEAFMVIVLDIP